MVLFEIKSIPQKIGIGSLHAVQRTRKWWRLCWSCPQRPHASPHLSPNLSFHHQSQSFTHFVCPSQGVRPQTPCRTCPSTCFARMFNCVSTGSIFRPEKSTSSLPFSYRVMVIELFFIANVVQTMPCSPSPSHHHFYRWYKLTIDSNGWFLHGIVFTTWIIH